MLNCDICCETYKSSDFVPSCKNRPDIHKVCRTCMKQLQEKGVCPFCTLPAPDPSGWELIKGYLWMNNRLVKKRLLGLRVISVIAVCVCLSISMAALFIHKPLFEPLCVSSAILAASSKLINFIWSDFLFIINFCNLFGNHKRFLCFCCEVWTIFMTWSLFYRYSLSFQVKKASPDLD